MDKNLELPLKILHLSSRYSLNTDDLSDILAVNFQKILRAYNDNQELRLTCQNLFYKILLDTLEINNYTKNGEKYKKIIKDLSFEETFKDKKCDNAGKYLDAISFKFYDYVFCDTKEQQFSGDQRLFGNWSYRVTPMNFIQKGQLWILNILNNTAKWAENKSQEEIDNDLKGFIRESLDKDFSPYYGKKSNAEMQEIIENYSKYGQKVKNKYIEGTSLPSTFAINEDRMLGFEIEAQFKDEQSNEIFKRDFKSKVDNPWYVALHRIHNTFLKSEDEKIKNTQVMQKNGDIIKQYGSIVRDGTVLIEDGYTAFEYVSPIAKNGIKELKRNVNSLFSLLHNNGVAVTDDAGTHLHVSIEDILPKESDDEKTKQEKLEAIKRIFVNYILIQDKIEQIIPEHRRSDHFWISSQTFESYVKGDKDLMIGLIDSAKNYEELRETLMVGGKYLPIAAFKDNIEFRCFPATTSAETMNTWFELLNTFVNNSIKGLPAEKCLDEKLYSKLQDLTKNGTYVEGRVGKRDFAMESCNSFINPLSVLEKKDNFLNYEYVMIDTVFKDDIPGHLLLTAMPIATNPDRQPGEIPQPLFILDTKTLNKEKAKEIKKYIQKEVQKIKNKLLQNKQKQAEEIQTRGEKRIIPTIEDKIESLTTKQQKLQTEQEREQQHQPKEIIPDSQQIVKLRQMFKDADKKVDESKDSSTKTSNSPSIGI